MPIGGVQLRHAQPVCVAIVPVAALTTRVFFKLDGKNWSIMCGCPCEESER